MSDLTNAEKRKLERLLGMSSGYVLDFSNRTFAEFVEDHTGQNIFDAKYAWNSGSKANRLRRLWMIESNHVVGNLIQELIAYGREGTAFKNDGTLPEECERIAARLLQTTPVPEIDALSATLDDPNFGVIVAEVRDCIRKNRPDTGLDRLHTFVTKFVRRLCKQHGVSVDRDKPLHSLFGECVKKLRNDGNLDSRMTECILRSTISVFEAFNDVRNNQSLAHDNSMLNYDESLLIFNHVTALVRFLTALELRIMRQAVEATAVASAVFDDDIPF